MRFETSFPLILRSAFVALVFIAMICPRTAHAVCTLPDGIGGDLVYNSDHSVLQYCNDTDWVGMGGPMDALDQRIGTLISGKWCSSDGSSINCTQDDPAGAPAGSVAGAVQFRGSSAVFAADDVNLVWDNTNKRLGIGTSTPDANAVLDVSSTTQGLLLPRVPAATLTGMTTPTNGLIAYDSTNHVIKLRANGVWVSLGSGGGGSGGNTMVAGWPDAIRCNQTGYGERIFFLELAPYTSDNLNYYKARDGTWITVDASGVVSGYGGITTNCNGQTIAQLYSQGRAYNFVGGASAAADGTAGQVQFNEGGNLKADADLHWDNANNRLGIGTTSPSSPLHVAGNIRTDQNMIAGGTTGGGYGLVFGTSGTASIVGNSSSNVVQITTASTARVTVNASGNVGIGTTTPTAGLDVYNGLHIHGTAAYATTGSGLEIQKISDSLGTISMVNGPDRTERELRTYGSPTTFYAGAAERMRIAAGGNVSIGSTGAIAKLDIRNTVAQGALRIDNAQSGSGDGLWIQNTGGSGRTLALHQKNSSGDILHAYYDGGSGYAIRMALSNAGALWIAGALTQNSDVNMKKDIVEIPDALEKLSRLRGVSYLWKDPQRGTTRQLGLVAQEVEREFPEVVSTQADGTKGVAYTSLIGPLIEAVKELKADNDILRADLKAANDNFEDLRKEVQALKADR